MMVLMVESSPRPRSDAARNRERLLAEARRLTAARGSAPHLAELATCTGLGVGTVYRHFPNRDALAGALAAEPLEAMLDLGREAVASGDPRALDDFLGLAIRMLAQDTNLASVFASSGATDGPDATAVALMDVFATLVDRAHVAGIVRSDLSVHDIHHLVCGVQAALRLHPEPDDATAHRYAAVLFAGLRPESVR